MAATPPDVKAADALQELATEYRATRGRSIRYRKALDELLGLWLTPEQKWVAERALMPPADLGPRPASREAEASELEVLRGRLRDIIGVSSPCEDITINCGELRDLLEGDSC